MNSAVKQLRTDLTNSEDAELADVLEAYFQALESGAAPSVEELLAQHPALADRLQRCLASLQFVEGAASQMVLPAPLDDLADENRRLGDYRLIREIGRGGMGIVYEAEQISLARRVALKVLPFASVLDSRQLQRFQNEALAAANLDHPNIVAVHGVGCERGVHFYVMRLISGATLAEVVAARRSQEPEARSPEGKQEANRDLQAEAAAQSAAFSPSHLLTFSPSPLSTSPVLQAAVATVNSASSKERFRRLATLGIEAAEALEHAHQMGVVHRDIKPSNLLIDERGKLWVTDFGLAQVESNATLTLPGDLLGTLRYMSPEQAAGRPTMIDHRTDIYSLGATLYELATDRPVVQAQERAAILREIAETDPAPPRKFTPAMPADFETILLKCLAKEPSARYDSSQALADDLRRFLEQKPVVARRPNAFDQLRKWSGRHRRSVVLLGVTSFLAFGAASVLQWRAYKAERAQTAIAKRQFERANANLDLARQAIDTFYLDYLGKDLAREAVLTKKQQEILEKALTFYEQAAEQNEQDLGQLPQAVKAHAYIARARFSLKDYAGALEAAEHALSIHDGLAHEDQVDLGVVENRFTSFLLVGTSLVMLERFSEAEKVLREAIAHTHDTLSGFSGLPTSSSIAHKLQEHLAHLLFVASRVDEAKLAYEEAARAIEQQAKQSPRDAAILTDWGDTLHSLGRSNACLGDLEQAIVCFGKAEDALQIAHSVDPADGNTVYMLEWVRFDLGQAWNDVGDTAKGLEHLISAAETVDDIAYSGPGDFDHFQLRINLLSTALESQLEVDDLDAWDEVYAKRNRAISRMKTKHGELPAARDCLATTHFELGNALLDYGKVDLAITELTIAEEHYKALASTKPPTVSHCLKLGMTQYLLQSAHTRVPLRGESQ